MIKRTALLLVLTFLFVSTSRAAEYVGTVGNLKAIFYLDFDNDGNVFGTYFYPSREGVVYTLSGNNHVEGKLYLEEYTGDALTARCFLSKTLTKNSIVWSGEMKNTDGRSLKMKFSRARN